MKKQIIRKSIGAVVIIAGLLLTGIYGCGGNSNKNTPATVDRQACIDTIKLMEAKLKLIKTPDVPTYNRAINAYLRFADNFPKDSMTPACFFDAANIAMSLSQYQMAINYYDTVNVKYPAFQRSADCVFIRGFIYDDKLKDTAKARVLYQEVIDKYPHDTALVAQARAAIAILGKSYDEIIKGFEEKNKDKKKS